MNFYFVNNYIARNYGNNFILGKYSLVIAIVLCMHSFVFILHLLIFISCRAG